MNVEGTMSLLVDPLLSLNVLQFTISKWTYIKLSNNRYIAVIHSLIPSVIITILITIANLQANKQSQVAANKQSRAISY